MKQQPRHLIVTSDVRTWKFDQPVIFLGKWCLREQDKDIWKKMDAVIAKSVGVENQDRFSLHTEARRIESMLFPRLVTILNEYQNVEQDQRYWRILLGHWLREIVQLLLNRIVTIERCVNENQILSITCYDLPKFGLAAKNYGDIWHQSDNIYWNAKINERLINQLQIQDLIIEKIQCEPTQIREVSKCEITNANKIEIYKTIYKNARQLVDRIARRAALVFGRENDAFIVNSYLPPEKELLLNMALGQFPQRRITPDFDVTSEVDNVLRATLIQKMKLSTDTKIEKIIAEFIFELIPINYLEGYKSLVEASELVKWPKNPKFIFTSNKFVADEIFKVWTAEKVSKGVPYFAGQHGNSYGTNKFCVSTIEEITSDRFLTWGWKGGLHQHLPTFIFKNTSNSRIRKPDRAGLLLIQDNPMSRFAVWDQADDFEKYMSEQFRFVSSLEDHVRAELLVRLHPAYAAMWGEGDIRWLNFDPNIKLELGEAPIRSLWKTNRLLVHSYDSTGMLETLEADRPTIAFWQNGLDHLVEEAIPYYEILISAGIVHRTPESAASKINEVWSDVDNWWMTYEVQNARKIFCYQYARTSKKPIRDLKKVFLENI